MSLSFPPVLPILLGLFYSADATFLVLVFPENLAFLLHPVVRRTFCL